MKPFTAASGLLGWLCPIKVTLCSFGLRQVILYNYAGPYRDGPGTQWQFPAYDRMLVAKPRKSFKYFFGHLWVEELTYRLI
jgi:hypothetical protein